MEQLQLSLTDKLAIDRTNLANERTFLAYFRTFIVFLSSGFAVINLELLKEVKWVGFMLIIVAPVLFLIGLLRFLYVKRNIKKYYK
jgi:putative membrane protein